ncbi:MAG: FecR domain-containing protein [Candidatus Omnitrophica bacterium]|nr:FecR domain-containing protein [Candidatus Omnitrophota bacterium]
MEKRLKAIFIIVMMLGLALTACATAQENAYAKLSEVRGSVEIKKYPGKAMAATAGLVLHARDIIRTRGDSGAILEVFADGTELVATIELRENSELRIIELMKKSGANTYDNLLDLALGEAMIKVHKPLAGKSRFEVKTPTSFIEAKGKTSFSVSVEMEK